MQTLEEKEIHDVLRRLRSQLSRIHHDVNNPLSVISGNSQLLLELAKSLGVEGELKDPLLDIEEALERMTESVDRLMIVRTILTDLEEKWQSGGHID